MTHPYNSSGSPVGLSALSGPAQQKISDHRASTDGLLHADALRFLWYLADHHGATLTAEWDGCAQEAVYGDPGFHRKFACSPGVSALYRSRMGLAVLLAGALRYCSLS
ncbi:hypothetical protein GUITHDRAFT_154069 [Guillardia theta CCMP2712]|uniref:Uncharacterized protein n=1 Tax=Guillardia theta (strain CCMP2712) TaxID=905079 RepID=L1IY41_GUITC|nr:hypothetical protein GUITHDRAFT_154069 [Guillardia theta CCMP2712]EKX40745.1 hypothetical protein GUITHDRAFT_154069 [Guillardia theta CCMP2712]|eukprot:XP_005827725.1 hypothetical protein GUITHDRAFT_154069 [Guillardia theta CCMP2712]